MIQIYLLSVIYLLFSASLFLVDSYRSALSFAIIFKGVLQEKRRALHIYILIGFLIAILLLVFPVRPGPRVLGDLLPALCTLYSALFFRTQYSLRRFDEGEAYYETIRMERYKNIGIVILVIALLHFLFPDVVLI